MVTKETNGTRFNPTTGKNEKVFCTVNGYDCPYYENGICYIADPVNECDDFNLFFETWEEWYEGWEDIEE